MTLPGTCPSGDTLHRGCKGHRVGPYATARTPGLFAEGAVISPAFLGVPCSCVWAGESYERRQSVTPISLILCRTAIEELLEIEDKRGEGV